MGSGYDLGHNRDPSDGFRPCSEHLVHSIYEGCKGIKTRLICDTPELFKDEAPYVLELNGFHSELSVVFEQ